MTLSGTLPLTRRCFFAAAGLGVAAGAVRAADPTDLPKAALLGDGDAKTYLLE
jgi:hypothetical protein